MPTALLTKANGWPESAKDRGKKTSITSERMKASLQMTNGMGKVVASGLTMIGTKATSLRELFKATVLSVGAGTTADIPDHGGITSCMVEGD